MRECEGIDTNTANYVGVGGQEVEEGRKEIFCLSMNYIFYTLTLCHTGN